MKTIDKTKLKKVKQFIEKEGADATVLFALDHLVKFIKGNMNATYQGEGAEYFKDVESLHLAIRGIAPDALTYDDV